MRAGISVDLDAEFDSALERVKAALAAEGFGIVSRIDLDRIFADKLGTAFRRYTILGACNPALADAALGKVPEVGLLLPCNVTVEETPAGSVVRLADPEAMASMLDRAHAAALEEVMTDAAGRIQRVAETLGGRAMD